MQLASHHPPENGPFPVPSEATLDKVWLDQLDLTMRLAPFAIATGLTVSSIVCFYFWEQAAIGYIVTLLSVTFLFGSFGFYACFAWRNTFWHAPAEAIRRIRRRMIFIAGVTGIALASIPVVFFTAADPDGRLLVAATCAGLIATGICIGFVPAAGLAFSGSIIIGSFAALATTGETFYAIIAALLAIYSLFIFATIVQISRLASRRALAQIDLDYERETTSLVLKDFEQNSSDWLWEIDAAGFIHSPSARFAEVAQKDPAVLRTMTLEALLRPRSGAPDAAFDELVKALRGEKAFRQITLPVEIGSKTYWWCLAGKPMFDRDQRFVGFRGIGSDNTLQIEHVANLDHLANHDVLTKLANRYHFEQLVSDMRSACLAQPDGSKFAVLVLDLDGFKHVNDTFGHAVGDEILMEIGRRLENLFGSQNAISRFDGDEFAVLSSSSDVSRNSALAREIIAALDEPFAYNGLDLDVGVSIGIATAVGDEPSTETLRKADVALYGIKGEGGGGFLFYSPDMDHERDERATLTGELRGALERGEFRLNYQPLVTATGELCGFEALMRWKHPEHGHVPPFKFIGLAEKTGAIVKLGEWGLREACAFAASWRDRSLSIAVNISAVQIRHSDLVAVVAKALADFDLEPERLELEITETAFLETTKEATETLRRLSELGVTLALDDFGTGYSTLSHLKKLPFDKIKIDRSFTADLPGDDADVTIVRTIIELARTLGKMTIAEGVETAEQQECLRQIGCPQLQGYLFGRPASESATMEEIERRSARAASATRA